LRGAIGCDLEWAVAMRDKGDTLRKTAKIEIVGLDPFCRADGSHVPPDGTTVHRGAERMREIERW